MDGDTRHTAPSGDRAGAVAEANGLPSLLRPAATAMGMDLESVKITSAGRRRLLRVVVDRDGGVSLDDLAEISRELSAQLDACGAMGAAPYTLEVSSPGVDRPLTEPRHWRRAAGRVVIAPLLTQPASEPGSAGVPASVQGRITGADDTEVRIDIDGQTRQFGYGDLGPGRIQVEFAPSAGARREGAGADEEDCHGH